MRTVTKSLVAAIALGATALPLGSSGVQAMPAIQPLPLASGTPAVTLTAGGCGPFAHRNFYGFCRPNGFGWHRGFGWRHRFGWHRWHYWHRW